MTGKSKLEDYQVEHLFVLVGRNPLPNYVAIKLQLESDGKLFLVHTTGPNGTGDIARRLAKSFASHNPKLIGVNPLLPNQLQEKIKQNLISLQANKLGLNYTGGTKLMAIHTRLAIEDYCEEYHRPDPIFSYLDADTMEMVIEPDAGQPTFQQVVIDAVEVKLQDLLELHNIDLRGRALQTEPIKPDFVAEISKLYQAGSETWLACRDFLEKNKNLTWYAIQQNLRDIHVPESFIEVLGNILKTSDNQQIEYDPIASEWGLKSSKELWDWLKGGWLEHWVLAHAQDLGYTHRACSIESFSPRQFEIDVAVMRGYRLFVISCYSGKKWGTAKLKLFEILARAQQLGGEEARVGLVCSIDDPSALQQEINSDLNTENQIRVFGREHIPDLGRYLKAWFETI